MPLQTIAEKLIFQRMSFLISCGMLLHMKNLQEGREIIQKFDCSQGYKEKNDSKGKWKPVKDGSICMNYKKSNKSMGILKNLKLRCCPRLTSGYKKVHIQFAEKHLAQQTSWFKIIFSHERKFNSDGPDGSYYTEFV